MNYLLAGILSLFIFSGVQAYAAATPLPVCSQDKCFQTEVMSTPEGRERGLMFRDGLSERQGMLFVFDESGDYTFWMKNMKFSIDILWIDDNKKVVHVEANIPPCEAEPCALYSPKARAKYVLEIPAGAAQKDGLQIGSVLKF